jgi:hypothetical protein
LPEGTYDERHGGLCWKLIKALYGLRISPRLWQEEASRVLTKLGLKSTSEDPCLFYTTGIIVFFYVDDIIIASHSTAREQAKSLIKALHNAWKLRDLGEPNWFLNIRILRDRSAGKLWLCQDAYITTMAVKFHLTERARITTPIVMEELKPYDGQASNEEIHLYQQKVGSVNYPTTMTRPDAAHAVAKLAQFLVNPGPKHHAAIDRVIIYLYHSRYLALQYGGHDITHSVNIFSDASFADNPDRKSSQGFLYQLYGGPIEWKASKQRTVSTSTTEAELLALSEAAKTAIWWQRLLTSLGFSDDECTTRIACDNQQTVDLVTKDTRQLYTKLRHVDIANHWIKEGVERGKIKVDWVRTANMHADGFTKALPREKHQKFISQLGMTDIRSLIESRL